MNREDLEPTAMAVKLLAKTTRATPRAITYALIGVALSEEQACSIIKYLESGKDE